MQLFCELEILFEVKMIVLSGEFGSPLLCLGFVL